MQSKMLSLIIALIIVIGGVVYFMTRPSVAPKNENANQEVTNTNVATNEPPRSFQTNGNGNENADNSVIIPPPTTQAVTISSSGITPRTFTIDVGTVVTFQNQDSVSHQISSNPHPSHSDLPGFDLVIGAGVSRSFTFSRAGNWGYHDHLSPFDSKFQGTVTVQ